MLFAMEQNRGHNTVWGYILSRDAGWWWRRYFIEWRCLHMAATYVVWVWCYLALPLLRLIHHTFEQPQSAVRNDFKSLELNIRKFHQCKFSCVKIIFSCHSQPSNSDLVKKQVPGLCVIRSTQTIATYLARLLATLSCWSSSSCKALEKKKYVTHKIKLRIPVSHLCILPLKLQDW